MRTGDHHRKGDFNVAFDDKNTVLFLKNQQIQQPTLTSEGVSIFENHDFVGDDAYASPNTGGGDETTGSNVAGITDNKALLGHRYLAAIEYDKNIFEKGESLSRNVIHPFNENRVLLKDTQFFLTGTKTATRPGFETRLHDKTQIVFELPNVQEEFLTKNSKARNDALDPTGQFLGKDKTGFVYYNWQLKKWEQIGLTDPASGRDLDFNWGVSVDRTSSPNQFLSGTDKFPAQFYASPLNDASPTVKLIQSWPNAGMPHINNFAPQANMYHATASQTLELKDHIKSPFLLEKVVVEFPYFHRRTHAGTNDASAESDNVSIGVATHQKDYVFFIYRQDRNATQQPIDSALDVTGSNRHLVVSGCMSFYNNKVYDYTDNVFNDWSPLNSPAFSLDHNIDVTSHTYPYSAVGQNFDEKSGVAVLELIPGVATKQLLGGGRLPDFELNITVDDEVNIPQYYWPGGTSFRGFGRISSTGKAGNVGTFGGTFDGTSAGNSLFDEYDNVNKTVQSIQENLHEIDFFDARAQSSGGVVTKIRETNGAILEGTRVTDSPYILLPEDKLVFGIDAPEFLHQMQRSNFANESTGSYLKLRTDKPTRVTLYGSLLRKNEEFHDNFNQHLTTENIHETIGYHEGLCLDQFEVADRSEFSGSYIDDFASGNAPGSVVSSMLGGGGNVVSGSLQRFIRINNFKSRYWDSYTPSIAEISKVLNNASFPTSAQLDGSNILKIAELKAGDDISGDLLGDFLAYYPHAQLDADSNQLKRVLSEGNIVDTYKPTNFIGTSSNPTFLGTDAGDNKSRLLATRYIYFGFGNGPYGSYGIGSGGRLTRPVGTKYGVSKINPQFQSAVFRYDHFGQPVDFLEQSKDTVFINVGEKTPEPSPIAINFIIEEEGVFKILDQSQIQDNTFQSSNTNIHATSSLPFFDDGGFRNRKYGDSDGGDLLISVLSDDLLDD